MDEGERFLVLLRHGEAEEAREGVDDAERALTSEGHARMKEIARGLEHLFPKAQAIYASPLKRAVQTAMWVAKAYRSRVKVEIGDALKPGVPFADFRAFVDAVPHKRIILVGHEPTLTDDALALLGVHVSALELKKGGCYGIRLRPNATPVLEWLLSPRVLRRLA